MRFVFDTNATISAALLEGSPSDRAFRKAIEIGEILLSVETLEELDAVLKRPKFDRYLLAEEREAFLVSLINRAKLLNVTESIRACRDPKDNKFLELAVSGGAVCIVTGDHHLLSLNPFHGVSILTPAEFLIQFGLV